MIVLLTCKVSSTPSSPLSVTLVLAMFRVNNPFQSSMLGLKPCLSTPTWHPCSKLLKTKVVKVCSLDIEVSQVTEVGEHGRQHQGVHTAAAAELECVELVSSLHDQFEGQGDGADHWGQAEAGHLGLDDGVEDVGRAPEVIHHHLAELAEDVDGEVLEGDTGGQVAARLDKLAPARTPPRDPVTYQLEIITNKLQG